jgi:hypothetical protein
VALVAALLWGWPRSASLPTRGPAGPIWLFQFAPERAADFANFVKVSGRTIYDPERGYGWLDLEGELATGTFHDASLSWESTHNLNLIQRAGPDELAASYANGSAAFALDLEPGSYDVWVLSGDFGLLEYVPHEPFEIEVEGVRVAFAPPDAGEWIQRFETAGPDDTIGDEEVYERYVAPRFRWEKLTVPVSDGQLSVRVVGAARDRSVLDTLGYYAHSDLKGGPPVRFTGALNALIVTRSDPHSTPPIDRVEELRRESFHRRWHKQAPPPPAIELDAADARRGYRVSQPGTIDPVLPDTIRPHEERGLQLRATPGEYVPLTFAVRPHRELGDTRVRVEALRGPQGAIDAASIQVGAVRYAANAAGERDPALWAPAPAEIVPGDSWQLAPNVTKQLWLTLHVPEDANPGRYGGAVVVEPERGEPARIELALEVLPFHLERPTHLASGVTYFVPIAYSLLGEERFWARVRADFADMRRHGLTTVQLTGMGIENYDGLDRLFAEYRAAGFEQPIYLLEAYAAIEHVVDRYGQERGSERFFTKYEELLRRLMDEATRRKWPPLIIDFGDEFTNSASEEFGAELARRLERIPGIVTAADADGYKEVVLLAPHVSVVAFSHGWDGPGGINRGRPALLQAGTVELIRAAGATPWLANIGRDRFSNGLYFWKLSRLGVRGKIEWIYSDYRADPHNPFDGMGLAGDPLAYPGPEDTTLPTLPYERMRQGLDDLAYLHTLERTTRAAPPGPPRDRAEALLERIDRMIDDDYAAYQDPKDDPWPDERYRRLRDEVVDAILPLLPNP